MIVVIDPYFQNIEITGSPSTSLISGLSNISINTAGAQTIAAMCNSSAGTATLSSLVVSISKKA